MWMLVLMLLVCLSLAHSFTLPSPKVPDISGPPIGKVAIIGSGIAGLSLAHALENSETCARRYVMEVAKSSDDDVIKTSSSSRFGIEVSLFDSRAALNPAAGAGVQLNGGMSALHKINPAVQKAVAKAAIPLKKIGSRAKPWQENGKDSYSTLLEIDLDKAFRQATGEAKNSLIIDGEVMAYSIMRGALQEALFDTLPPGAASRVNFAKTLSGISCAENEKGIMCEFSDGTSEGPFDMVIGCDGAKSAVKEYIDTKNISTNAGARKGDSALYSGIRVEYAVQDGDPNAPWPEYGELYQYFGDGAYALAGVYGAGEGRPPTTCAFLITRDKEYNGPFKKKEAANPSKVNENADWTQDVRSVGDARSDCLNRVKEAGVPNLQVNPIIKQSDRFFDLGVYFHNPWSLQGWSREVEGSGGRYCVLAGDAAHTMPPFLGQGSNQAIQDAYCLATKIFEHQTNCLQASVVAGTSTVLSEHQSVTKEKGSSKTLKALLKDYESVRWFPTASTTVKAAFLGYLETGGKGFFARFRDSFFFMMGKLGVARKIFLDAATPRM